MITLKDIALEAKVTVPTVSRALKGDPEIAQATRDRIAETAFRLGYRPRRGDSERMRIMGIVIPDMSSKFFTDVLAEIDLQLSEMGYIPLYAPFNFEDDSCKKAFELCKKRNVAGILAISIRHMMEEYIRQFTAINAIPVVMMMHELGASFNFLDSVQVDLTDAIAEAIAVFKRNGHKRIGLMTDTVNIKARGLEFDTAFRKHGFQEGGYPIFLTEERFEEGGYLCMKEALRNDRCPTAFMIGYDHFAIGACKAIREAGLQVPENIVLCGIDNLGLDDYINPALSSIATPIREMVRTAFEYMRRSLKEGPEKTVFRTTLSGKLYVRESMGQENRFSSTPYSL